jgi:hypothetical protein
MRQRCKEEAQLTKLLEMRIPLNRKSCRVTLFRSSVPRFWAMKRIVMHVFWVRLAAVTSSLQLHLELP